MDARLVAASPMSSRASTTAPRALFISIPPAIRITASRRTPIAKEPGTIMEALDGKEALERMRQLLLAVLVSLVAGCSAAPSDPTAARAAWEARDEQRALECQQQRGRYFGGSCTYGGR
jgi:hypothetical protein